MFLFVGFTLSFQFRSLPTTSKTWDQDTKRMRETVFFSYRGGMTTSAFRLVLFRIENHRRDLSFNSIRFQGFRVSEFKNSGSIPFRPLHAALILILPYVAFPSFPKNKETKEQDQAYRNFSPHLAISAAHFVYSFQAAHPSLTSFRWYRASACRFTC